MFIKVFFAFFHSFTREPTGLRVKNMQKTLNEMQKYINFSISF